MIADAPRFSFIVPFGGGVFHLARCLDALIPLRPGSELIVAADGALEDCRPVAVRHGARVIALPRRCGPAVARNAAAAAATGDVLVFVDADVVVSRAGLSRILRTFIERPQIAAVFGSYDDHPADAGFVSQYKNLSHAFVHRTSPERARTFWAGFGAVRRDAFDAIGGFDERFDRPSVEDIDLGYRLTNAGYEVRLDATVAASHLKRWTMRSTIVSDVRDRGIPWTQLIWRYGGLHDDLNLRNECRVSVALVGLGIVCLLLAPNDRRLALMLPLAALGVVALNHRYYRFFYVRRGTWFTIRVGVLHVVQQVCNGFSFAAGTALYVAARYLGLRLPGALPVEPWTGRLHDRSRQSRRYNGKRSAGLVDRRG